MVKEVEPLQMALIAEQPIEPALRKPVAALAEPKPAQETLREDDECAGRVETDPPPELIEIPRPRATLRDVRAARSLLYNRLLLEVVRRRVENAEAILLSYLLTQESTSAQLGPYLVELDEAERLDVTKTENDDGWRQLHIPEAEEAFEE